MKKMLFILVISISLVIGLNAAQKTGCVLGQKGKIVVSFKAYKTPAKIGVGGVFDDVLYTPIAKEGKNFREILVGSTVKIATTSVNSKNKNRDEKLVRFFFKMMTGKYIDAKIIDIKANPKLKNKPRTGIVTIDVTMNNITKRVPMKYSFFDGKFGAKATIDILDFSASKALSSINKACYDLHKGKTWSDVEISFNTKIEALLCNVKPLK